MSFDYKTTVTFSCCDLTGTAPPSTIIDFMQDCAGLHTASLYQSSDYQNKHNKVWILSSWQVIFDNPCHTDETVKISTWASGYNKLMGIRNFTVKTEKGVSVAKANSLWILMDMATKHPVKIEEADMKYAIEEPLAMEKMERKIKIPAKVQPLPPQKVCKYHIDKNGHMNNAWYVRLAEEYLPVDCTVKKMRVEYKSPVHLGDTIYPLLHVKDSIYTIVIANENQKPYATVEFTTL